MDSKINLWPRFPEKSHCQFHQCKEKLNQPHVMGWKKMSFSIIGKMETEILSRDTWRLTLFSLSGWQRGLVDITLVLDTGMPDVHKYWSERNIHYECHFFLFNVLSFDDRV